MAKGVYLAVEPILDASLFEASKVPRRAIVVRANARD
jgi:hypothetical protein